MKQLLKKIIFKINYLLGSYQEVIWLIGDARSGTTWVMDLINFKHQYREMFEPFHPFYINDVKHLLPHQYIKPNKADKRTSNYIKGVFEGRYYHPRIDAGNKIDIYKGILIKDIFANLLSYWASQQFSKAKFILLIRNPFAIAVSKYNKDDGIWAINPLDLLHQKDLFNDYLQEFEELIIDTSRENDFVLNQVLTWSIINYIPLQQFRPENIHICFYENIVEDPEGEVSSLFQFIKGVEKYDVKLDHSIISKPSRVTDKKNLNHTSQQLHWKNKITPYQFTKSYAIMERFGLDKLYDEHSLPNIEVIRQIQKKQGL